MSLVRFENVSKAFASAPILENIDFRVEEGEHIGLIGRNGTGKSTIFRLITGEITPESGVIERMRKARMACLAQLPNVDGKATIFDVVLHSFRELLEQERELAQLEERMARGDEDALHEYSKLQEAFTLRGGYEFRTNIKRVLQGLGFHPNEFDLPYHALSGGQRTRLMLALVLLQDADLLLLDEPENHLDLEAREWLEEFLKNSRAAIVIISHDRKMLNEVVTRIVEVERGQLFNYTGNYDGYLKAKALLREQQQKAFERQQEFIRKEEAWIDRFRYKNTKARQVQSRIRRLEKMEMVEAPPPEAGDVTFAMGDVVRSGEIVLDVQNISMGYDRADLYHGVSFHVQRGERVGIIGPNGSGKTTMLRQMAGQLKGRGGEVKMGFKVTMAYYDQHHENMNRANDILNEIWSIKQEWVPQQVRSYMGKFLFSGDDVFKPISALSGGELSRTAMAKLILSEPNLLLLDEPTNHLDIASREALESALLEFPGAIVMASHDRALIDKMVDKLIILQNGKAEVHLGNYSHYRWKHQQELEQKEEQKKTEDVLKIRRVQEERQEKKARERENRKQQRQLEQLERDIETMEELIESYHEKFAAVDPADYQAAQQLKEEYEGLKNDLQQLYEEWESLVE
ncbi:MAG TPA: ABC-F family ATP-binding cassette domain-containing protein [Candidatus Hydrogenedentes bacterium]|nr:ABC-F family ATP-binding cassette domain-containing protein [Candidatus Hydrogenedentota bacterium]